MMYGVLTFLPLLYYQKTTNSAVNRNVAGVINNWNNFSKCVCIEYDLLTWVINMI